MGGSIEDYDPEGHLYEVRHAAERIAAAAEAAHGLGFPFTLTARSENYIRGNPDLADTIERLQAYEEAGADVLYAPGLSTAEAIRTVCAAVSKPVNVLALPGLSLAEIFDAGAQRVSVGGGLTWVALAGDGEGSNRHPSNRAICRCCRLTSRSTTGSRAEERSRCCAISARSRSFAMRSIRREHCVPTPPFFDLPG